MLVVQWRLRCNICTLWQRIGRAARDQSLQGTGLIFVDKAHFDDVKEAREHSKSLRKARKHIKEEAVSRTLDPPRLDTGDITAMEIEETEENLSSDNENDGDAAMEVDDRCRDIDEEPITIDVLTASNRPVPLPEGALLGLDPMMLDARRLEYFRAARSKLVVAESTKHAKKRKVEELGPDLQDIVNADRRGLKCRRLPITLAFSSDKAGAYSPSKLGISLLYASCASLILLLQKLTIISVTPQHL
jgi:superfamily II DNA/RNA helicase